MPFSLQQARPGHQCRGTNRCWLQVDDAAAGGALRSGTPRLSSRVSPQPPCASWQQSSLTRP